MGTPCDIQLYGSSRIRAREAIEAVIADIERMEARYSRYRENSVLSEINRVAAVGGEISLDPETASLMDYADTCFQQSDGLFDISSGILRRAWNFKSGTVPEQATLDALLELIGWQKLEWKSPILRFPIAGMELDLGGIVKEYAVDRAVTLCQSLGVHNGIINLGGDIRIIGPHPDGSAWRVGVRNPSDKHKAIHTLELYNGALASSGDYERCIELDGVRYGHVLNPKSGWPVRHLAAVSVTADLCVVAGSASTIGMLKESAGIPWLQGLNLPFLSVDVDGNTEGTLLASD